MNPEHTGHGAHAPSAPEHAPAAATAAKIAEPAAAGGGATYSCPMHPEVVRSEPGSCPKCGMTLELRKAPVAGQAAHGDHAKHAEHAEHADMMLDDHRKMLWPHYVNSILGIWLLTHPFSMGYLSNFVPDANVLRVMVG